MLKLGGCVPTEVSSFPFKRIFQCFTANCGVVVFCLFFFKPWKHVFEWEVITEIKWPLLAGVHTAFLEEISHSSTLSHSHLQFEHIQFCWSQRHNYLLQAHLVSAAFSINAFTSFPAVPQAVLKSHKMQLSRSILKTQNSRLLRL